ncbi:bacterial regulatory helix-turn-helix, lysR family protein, partial [Vibrio parahaemolyticus V-223/04]
SSRRKPKRSKRSFLGSSTTSTSW